jgi:hypothetical protein
MRIMGIMSGGFAIVADFRSDILCLYFGVGKFGGQWDSVAAVYRCKVSLCVIQLELKYSYSNDTEFSIQMKLVWPIEMLKSPVESLFR